MPVVTIGTTGASWGLTAETGIIVQTATRKTSRDKNEVRDNNGDITLVGYYNPMAKYTIAGVIRGTSGIAAAAPGIALTIANANTGNGVTTGGVYTDDVDVNGANVDFQRISATATQYNGIA